MDFIMPSLMIGKLAGGPMEYEEEDGVAGSIPEFGAIFMSNLLTKKDCFKHKVFALPSSKAEFVKHVKAGMVLFLFECKKRQLFGVYQASSDGAMDIVPHGFNYSGRHFPAQVCFRQIWNCDPLSEREFQDAIRDNYFSAKLFNFGLSENQVQRLLSLFSSRKLKKEMPPRPLTEVVTGVAGKERRQVGDNRLELSERGFTEPSEYDEFDAALYSDYRANSLVEEDEVLVDDRVNTARKGYPLGQGDFLAKRRRIDYDDGLLANDMEEAYNYGALRTFHSGSPRDFLDEVRKLADARRLLTIQRLHNENQLDKIRDAVQSSDSLMNPLDVRTGIDDRFMKRNRLFDEYNMDKGFASERFGQPLHPSNHATDDDGFLIDDYVQRKQNIHDMVKPMFCGDGNPSLSGQAMQVIEDHPRLMNRVLEKRYQVDCDVSPFSASEHSANLLRELRKRTSGARFPANDRIQGESNFAACTEDFSSGKISPPLHYVHGIIHDRKYPTVEGRITENMVDSSAASSRNAGYYESVDGRVFDDGRFRKSEGVERDIQTRFRPVISFEDPSFSKQKRSLSSVYDKLPEKGLSQMNVAHNFGPSRSSFDDATITRSTPYTPEHPNFSHGFTASMTANQNSRVVLENPHRGSQEDFYSYKNRLSPYFIDSEKSSWSLGIATEFGNKGVPTSGHLSSFRHETSFLNPNLPMHVDLNTSVPVNHGGSLFSKSSFSPPAPDRQNMEGEDSALFGYPFKSSENHFEFDRNLSPGPQYAHIHVPRREMDCSEANESTLGNYHPERHLTGYENQNFLMKSHLDSNIKRRSVFTRLTSRQESQGGEERNESGFARHEGYMDATADEVMEMLRQSNNLSEKKPKKVGQPKHGESAIVEKQPRSHNGINNSAMEKKKLYDAHLAIEESIDEVPKESRIMDFKRRSGTSKNLVGASTDSASCNKSTRSKEEVGSPIKTTLKRRKLVRPVFGKTESATEIMCSSQNLQVHGQILEKDDKRSHERAISICEAEMHNDNTRLNVLILPTDQSLDCNIEEHSNPEDQKDIGVRVLPSSSEELKEHRNVGLHNGNLKDLLMETTQHKSVVETSVEDISSKTVVSTACSSNLETSSSQGLELGAGCSNNLLEGKNIKMKRKRKITSNKTGMEPSQ